MDNSKIKVSQFPAEELEAFQKDLKEVLDKHSAMLVAEPQIVIKRVEMVDSIKSPFVDKPNDDTSTSA